MTFDRVFRIITYILRVNIGTSMKGTSWVVPRKQPFVPLRMKGFLYLASAVEKTLPAGEGSQGILRREDCPF